MQNQEDFSKKESKNAKSIKNAYFSSWHQKLKEKSKGEVEKRSRMMLEIIGSFLFGMILSGKETLFETFPLGIPLICGVGKYYIASAAGAIFGGLIYGVGMEYIFAYIAVTVMRFLMSLPITTRAIVKHTRIMPEGYEEKSAGELDGKKSKLLRVRGAVCRIFSIPEDATDKISREIAETLFIKCVISSVGGFIAGLFLLIQTEFSYYSLYSLVFMMLASPMLTLLLSGVFSDNVARGGILYTVSVASAMVLCTYASGYVNIFTIGITPMLALLFTLIVARERGILSSLIIAFLTGICFDIRYAPMLMISGIIYILIKGIRLSLALMAVSGICLVWSYYFSDISSFVRILPPTLLAIPVFLIYDKYASQGDVAEKRIWHENKYFAKSVSEESKNLAVKARVSSLSDAFSSLSEAVSSLSDKFRRPDTLGLRKITDSGFETVCEGCPNFAVCYGAEYNRTVEAQSRVTSALHKKGYVEEGDLGESFYMICVRRKKLIEKTNQLCAESTERIITGQRIGMFASNYDDIRDILQDAIEADSEEYECDTDSATKIYDYLKGEGYVADGVVVCGKRCRRVMIKGVHIKGDANDESGRELCKSISEIVGVKLVGPVFEVGDDGLLMLFSAKPKLRAICSSGRLAAFEVSGEEMTAINPFDASINEKREESCGDVTNSFLTDTSYFYSLISDGMGSGSEAAFSAGISSMFCEKMLMAGNRADITIRMLNNFLRAENSQRGSESSVTVDIFELDLMLGVASFIKSGAAPTYILRGGEVYKIHAKTMPVGIIKNPDIKITRFDIRSGDLVLMMSDGISGEGEDCEWIAELLGDIRPPECSMAAFVEGEKFASSLRDKIFCEARERMKRANKFDDVSLSIVLVV